MFTIIVLPVAGLCKIIDYIMIFIERKQFVKDKNKDYSVYITTIIKI